MKRILTVIIIGLLFAPMLSILSPGVNASNSPVGYWKFDEGSGITAADSSGNGNTGTLHGATWTNGIVDSAPQFDGINDYVGIADSPSLRLTSNQASLELWFKPTATLDSTLTHRINILDKGNNYGFQMEPGARIFFTVWIGGNQWLGTVTSNWIAGKWYHIAGTYDGTTEKVYVNGVLENSQSISGSLSGSSYPLSIGSYCLGTMNFFNGAIDEVEIYDYARTAQEIQNDYNSAKVSLPWKDDFNYNSLSEMKNAGWTLSQESLISVGGGAVTLDNTGSLGSYVSFTNFPSGVYDWRAESRGMWIGRSYGSLNVQVITDRHSYGWAGDGYYPEFVLYRDAVKVLRFGGYTPQLNTWEEFTLEKRGNTLYMYYNDELKNTYVEPDSTPSALSRAELISGWVTTSKYDYVSVSSGPTTTISINIFDESGFPPASIHGTNRIANMPIRIYTLDDVLVASGSTDASGTASFNLADDQYKIVYGSKVIEHFGVASKVVDVSGGSMNLDLYSFQAQFHTYSGGGPYELDYIDLDKSSAGYQDAITVQPGQQINAEFSWWELETVNYPVWLVSAFGSWNPTSALGNLASGCASPWSHDLHTIPLTFTAPNTPGTYEVRLVGVLDYDWPNSFYTAAHYQPSLGRDTGISIISKTIDGPYGVGTIIVGGRSRFDPSVDGFRFSNNEFTDKIKMSIEEIKVQLESSPIASEIPSELWIPFEYLIQTLISTQQGYCGGMVWTAKQYYEHPELIPSGYSHTHDIDKTDPVLTDRLVYNQWITQMIEDNYYLKRLLLMLGNDPSGLVPFDNEVDWIISQLDQFKTVELTVFDPSWSWGMSHAVLAYDYAVSGNNVNLNIYGPNYGGTQIITLEKDANGNYAIAGGVSCIESFAITRFGSEEAPTWGLTWETVLSHWQEILSHVIEKIMASQEVSQFLSWVKDNLKNLWDDFKVMKDQYSETWNQFTNWVSDKAKDVWNRLIHFKLHSAANLNLYNSTGAHVGLLPTGDLELEFDSLFLDSDEMQYCCLPDPMLDACTIRLEGAANGDYALTIEYITPTQTLTQTFYGTISEQEVQVFSVEIFETELTFQMIADVNIDPDTLNLASKGRWITSYIELSESVNVNDINVSSILLNGTIQVDLTAPVTIGDCDNDGIPDIIIKFDRAALESWIYHTQGIRYRNIALTISGTLNDGTDFEGTDTVFVNYAGDANNDGVINIFDILAVKSRWATTPDSLNWVPEYDVNSDEAINIFDVLMVKSNWGQTTP